MIIPYCGILRPVMTILGIVVMILQTRTIRNRKTLYGIVGLYLFFVLYVTFFCRSAAPLYSYRLRPFIAISQAFTLKGGLAEAICRWMGGDFGAIRIEHPEELEGIVLNILLFVPMGYLLKQLYPKLKLYHIALIAFAVSLSIEVLQLVSRYGMFEVDDLIHNTIGAMGGWVIQKRLCERTMIASSDNR